MIPLIRDWYSRFVYDYGWGYGGKKACLQDLQIETRYLVQRVFCEVNMERAKQPVDGNNKLMKGQ